MLENKVDLRICNRLFICSLNITKNKGVPMKRFFSLALILTFALIVSAEEDAIDPTKTTKYAMPAEINTISIHPLSLIVTSAVKVFPMYVYITYERNYAPKNALILTPNYLSWKVEDGDDSFEASGYGLGIGIRHYLSKPVSGIYLQAKADLGYATIKVSDGYSTAEGSGLGVDFIGSIGAKGKWDKISIFADLGLGFGISDVSAKTGDYEASVSNKGLSYGGNFGIGYSF